MPVRPLVLALLLAASPAVAQSTGAENRPVAETNAPDLKMVPAQRRAVLTAQVLLDRAGFAPGVIDGQTGSNTKNAVAAWRRARGEPADGAINAKLVEVMAAADGKPTLTRYTITAVDAAGPFQPIPKPIDYKVLSEREALGWQSPLEGLAERFHTSEAFLKLLNPKADFGRAGQEIVVPAVGRAPLRAKVDKIEVDKKAKQVRAFAGDDLLAVYPASIGSADTPTPSGEWKVRAVADKPTYTYDPARLTKTKQGDEKLVLPAGPNNPVGAVWIDLSKDTYGIHGTPDPATIGKAQSSGCVRLTNWDAWQLAKSVETGATVKFVG